MSRMTDRILSSSDNEQIDEFRVVARLVGMLAVLTGLVYLPVVGREMLAVGPEVNGRAPLWLLFAALLAAIVGVLLSWRQEGIGGVVAVLSGLALASLAYFTTTQHRGFSAFAYGSPFLITGVLFLVCWRRSCRRRAAE